MPAEDDIKALATKDVDIYIKLTGSLDGDGDFYLRDSEQLYVDIASDDDNFGHDVHLTARWLAQHAEVYPAGYIGDDEVKAAVESIRDTLRARSAHTGA